MKKKTLRFAIPAVLVIMGTFVAWWCFRLGPKESPALPDRRSASEATAPEAPVASGEAKSLSETKDAPRQAILKLRGRELPLVFEDDALSAELRQIIIADMNTMFGHLDDCVIGKMPYNKSASLSIGGGTITTVEEIVAWEGRGVFKLPKYNAVQSNLIVRVDGSPHLVISRELIGAYRRAVTFREEHVKVFAALQQMIDEYNRGFPDVTADKLEDYFWFAETARPIREEVRRDPAGFIRQVVGDQKFGSPMLLAVRRASEVDPNQGFPQDDPDLLIADLYRLDAKGIPVSLWGLMYYHGRWRVPLAAPPSA